MTDIKGIKTDEEYKAALARIEELMDTKIGISGFDEFNLLISLVEFYEDNHYPIGGKQ